MKIEDVWQEWNVEKKIGRGSYGTVYKCYKEENGERQYAAIKVISVPGDDVELQSSGSLEHMTAEQSKAFYKEIVDGFMREISIMESLKGHPNIVRIDDSIIVEDEDRIGWHLFIRMELLTDFNTYSCDRIFTEKDVIKMAADLSCALKACAEKKVIHRDIKPENIFVDESGTFKLGDFGVAKQLERTETAMSRKGTFNYMAPEVLNAQNGDSRADIYSLGIVMYQLLNNNRLPFLDPNKQFITHSEREKAFKRRAVDGEKLPDLPNVSPELNAIILRATQFKKEERFKNVNEFISSIAVLAEKGKSARIRALRWTKKRKIAVVFASVLLVVVIGVGVFAALQPDVFKRVFLGGVAEQTNVPEDNVKPVVYQVENSGRIHGVFSIDGVDYYATHEGFFRHDGNEIKQLSDQPCSSDFSIINDKIFYTVIDDSISDSEEIVGEMVDLLTAKCSCWVMDYDGNNKAELFKYNGCGYVISVINDDIYYLDDQREVNVMAGTGRTLFTRSLTEATRTTIHEDVGDVLPVSDKYLFFNEYVGGGDYAGSRSYRYDCSTGTAKELDITIATSNSHNDSYGHMILLDKNTILLFYTEKYDQTGDGSFVTEEKIGKYSIVTDSIKPIKDGHGAILNSIDSSTIGIVLVGEGYYLFDKETNELTLFSNDINPYAKFLDKNTLLVADYENEDTSTFELIAKDGKKSSSYECAPWDFALGKNIFLYWSGKDNTINYDNCTSLDGIGVFNTLVWKESNSTFLVPATGSMLSSPYSAYVKRTDYLTYPYINVRYGPSTEFGIIEKIDDYSSVKRLSEKVDGWYLCFTDFVTGWIDGDYVFDGEYDDSDGITSENVLDQETDIVDGTDQENDVSTKTQQIGPLNFQYEKDSNGNIVITGYIGDVPNGKLDIPEIINGAPVVSIDSFAFHENNNITELILPEGLIEIGTAAFCDCENLFRLKLPKSLKVIGSQCFQNTSILDVSIPKNVSKIEENAFRDCKNLNKISVNRNNQFYKNDAEGVLYSKDMSQLIQFPPNSTVVEYTIPNSVTEMDEASFELCKNIENVHLSKNLKTISAWTFGYCSKLKNIEIPKGIESIGYCAFDGCSALEEVSLPKTVTELNEQCFASCSLKVVTIMSMKCDFGDGCFAYNSKKKMLIRGYEDSSAQHFANSNKIKFEVIE